MRNWIEVTVNGEKYEALVHALYAIGFKHSSGRPYSDEIDKVWRKANKELKMNVFCTVNKNNTIYTITLSKSVRVGPISEA